MVRPARRRAPSSNPVVERLRQRWLAELRSVVGSADGVVVALGDGTPAPLLAPGLRGVRLRHRPAGPATGPEARSSARTLIGDVDTLPFPDSCADLVTCIGLLETLPSHRRAVSELARITAGRCVVSVPWEPWARIGHLGRGNEQSFTPKRLVRALRRGFRDVELHPCFPWLVAECRGPRT